MFTVVFIVATHVASVVTQLPHSLRHTTAHTFIWMPQKHPADGLQHGLKIVSNCLN